jgi:GT2 family glycosyltransferase
MFSFTLADSVDVESLLDTLKSRRAVTVAVPVYNGGHAVVEGLEALLRFTDASVRIVVIDDASTDVEIVDFLDGLATTGRIDLTRHPINLGYTATANEAIAIAAPDDVVLLNSDASVGPLWLPRMRWVQASSPRVGTVSAVSNHAGTMSVPQPHVANSWHVRRPWHEVARHIAREMTVWDQVVPAAHGFCMLISRDLIDDIGGFDIEAFPAGYGEEVDFSQRGAAAGWLNLVAPQVIVHHRRSQSFGVDRRAELVAQSKPVLERRYPMLGTQAADWVSSVGDLLIRTTARRLQLFLDPAAVGSWEFVVDSRHESSPGMATARSWALADAYVGLVDPETRAVHDVTWDARAPIDAAIARILIHRAVDHVRVRGASEVGRRTREIAGRLGIPTTLE